jgi:hypothetical protein
VALSLATTQASGGGNPFGSVKDMFFAAGYMDVPSIYLAPVPKGFTTSEAGQRPINLN